MRSTSTKSNPPARIDAIATSSSAGPVLAASHRTPHTAHRIASQGMLHRSFGKAACGPCAAHCCKPSILSGAERGPRILRQNRLSQLPPFLPASTCPAPVSIDHIFPASYRCRSCLVPLPHFHIHPAFSLREASSFSLSLLLESTKHCLPAVCVDAVAMPFGFLSYRYPEHFGQILRRRSPRRSPIRNMKRSSITTTARSRRSRRRRKSAS